MIIDTTLFNNEFDMLDIRIELTKSWVDRWIICEGNRTLSGRPKPFHLTNALDRYRHLGDRLQVIALDIPGSWTNWDIENGQRAALASGYSDADPDTVVMHSDLDEILNPESVPSIMALLEQHDQPVSCRLDMYMYRLDQRIDRGWNGTVVAKKRHFQDPCTLYKGVGAGAGTAQKKKDRSHCVFTPGTVGWHWGWMGDKETVKNKVISCIETQHRDSNEVYNHFLQGRADLAINHKCATQQVTPNYPPAVMAVLKTYPWWTKENSH